MSDLSNNLQKNEAMVLDVKMHWIAFFIHPIRYLTTELSLSTKRVVGKYGFLQKRFYFLRKHKILAKVLHIIVACTIIFIVCIILGGYL